MATPAEDQGQARRHLAVDQVLTIASQLEEYVVLFAALEEERRTQLFTAYGEQISGTAESAARLAAAAIEATGRDRVLAANLAADHDYVKCRIVLCKVGPRAEAECWPRILPRNMIM